MSPDKPEANFIEEDGYGKKKVHLDVFVRVVIQRCMGKALDYARLTGMSDRSMTQFERSLKDDHYKIIEDAVKTLKEFGYIADEQ